MNPTTPRRHRRRFIAIGVAGLIGIGSAGALAFFLSRGTGTASQHVTTGSAPILSVTILPQAVVGPALLPAGAPDTFLVRVNNSNAVAVELQLTPTVRKDAGGGIFDTTSATFVDACQASWFSATMVTGGVYTIPAGNTPNLDSVTVSLTDTGTDQSACEALAPEIGVTAS
jgi:hypothetical protein